MSTYSLKAAIKYGETLREFHDISEAEDFFISNKDHSLARTKAVCLLGSGCYDFRIQNSEVIYSI